eukprot:NODE_140_length_17926_cov_0.139620.p15 type:complete len:122 gc:universal NODE_140_length_17926_cov_0.139620:1728-2093(+)
MASESATDFYLDPRKKNASAGRSRNTMPQIVEPVKKRKNSIFGIINRIRTGSETTSIGSNNNLKNRKSSIIASKDSGLYDEAMTCLCFRCDKCLRALENTKKINESITGEENTVEFVTEYW